MDPLPLGCRKERISFLGRRILFFFFRCLKGLWVSLFGCFYLHFSRMFPGKTLVLSQFSRVCFSDDLSDGPWALLKERSLGFLVLGLSKSSLL